MSYDIFEKLCQMRHVTPAEVSRQTGIATATLSNWKKGRYTPKREKMQKIADYFDVSIEYLINGSDQQGEPLDADLLFIRDAFKVLSADDKEEILTLIRLKLARYKEKENVHFG